MTHFLRAEQQKKQPHIKILNKSFFLKDARCIMLSAQYKTHHALRLADGGPSWDLFFFSSIIKRPFFRYIQNNNEKRWGKKEGYLHCIDILCCFDSCDCRLYSDNMNIIWETSASLSLSTLAAKDCRGGSLEASPRAEFVRRWNIFFIKHCYIISMWALKCETALFQGVKHK